MRAQQREHARAHPRSTQDGGHLLPHHIESGTGPSRSTTELQYTASGQRVFQRTDTNNTTTVKTFIGDLYELTVASFVPAEHRYKVLVGSRQVAEVVRSAGNEQTYYLHEDHLGSVTAITNASNNAVESRSYDPFGSLTSQGNTTGVRASYTGHDDDAGLGLVNARGRLYDAKLGRFVSADPFVTNPGSSQGWNRYAYVENNPLAFTDPSGFDSYCPVINDVAECGCVGTPEDCAAAAAPPGPSYDEARQSAQRQEDDQRRGDALSNANNGTMGDTPNGVPPGFDQPTITNPSGLPGVPNPLPTREQNWEAAKAGAQNFVSDALAFSAPNILQTLADPLGFSRYIADFSGDSLRADVPTDPRLREQHDFMRNGLTFLSVAAGLAGGGLGASAERGTAGLMSRAGDILYHGTDLASAQQIAAGGLNRTAARALGGGDLFWTTAELSIARWFSRANPAMSEATGVVGMRLPGTLAQAQQTGLVALDKTGAYVVKNWEAFNNAVTFFLVR